VATRLCLFGDLIPTSESVARWLCAWPVLLGWGRRVNWLFLRVFDSPNRKAGYTLWGIDSSGRLLIVEIRTHRTQTLRDPFRSFVASLKKHGEHHMWSTRELRARWRDYIRSDQNLAGELSTSCKRDVELAFAKRQAAGNPPPILMVVVAYRAEFRLSDNGFKNLLFLEKLAGSSRVVLRTINCRFGRRGMRINCWSPRSSGTRKRGWPRLR
jgi:hypothetical protein